MNANALAVNSTTIGLPVTPDAFQSSTDGSDFYLMVLDPKLPIFRMPRSSVAPTAMNTWMVAHRASTRTAMSIRPFAQDGGMMISDHAGCMEPGQ